MVDPIKDQSIGTKTSLEKLNNILQELHKNIMKENSSNNIIKSSNKEDKNKTEEENINQNDDQSDFINEIKSNKEEIDDQDKERTTGDNVGDINDRISNNHINRLKISETIHGCPVSVGRWSARSGRVGRDCGRFRSVMEMGRW